ncbi:MAG: hypothetical protein K8R08_10020 [Methanosarcinales archaeon]|nr:hypothetical protein [Methanosarcinales archaeon]
MISEMMPVGKGSFGANLEVYSGQRIKVPRVSARMLMVSGACTGRSIV